MSAFLRVPTGRVHLRPQPSAVPTVYYKNLEKSGIVSMPQQNLAIYTCKSGPRQGPIGLTGEDGADYNSWYDTIIAAASDEYSPISIGGPKFTYRCPYPLDLTDGYIRISLTEAPEGAAFIVDVHMNEVSMFESLIQIDEDAFTSVGSAVPNELSTLYIPDDAKLEIYVIQVGIIATGVGLKVAITGIKAP